MPHTLVLPFREYVVRKFGRELTGVGGMLLSCAGCTLIAAAAFGGVVMAGLSVMLLDPAATGASSTAPGVVGLSSHTIALAALPACLLLGAVAAFGAVAYRLGQRMMATMDSAIEIVLQTRQSLADLPAADSLMRASGSPTTRTGAALLRPARVPVSASDHASLRAACVIECKPKAVHDELSEKPGVTPD
jgi:hypothetical protein